MISIGPENQSVLEGDNAVFHCTAPAEPPVHTVVWKFQGIPFSQGNKYNITSEEADTSVLTILNVSTSDAGEYTCFVANQHANDSVTAVLNVFSKYFNTIVINRSFVVMK